MVDIRNDDRIQAILIIEGKAYYSDCDHQECFMDYMTENDIPYEDVNIHETFCMKNNYEVYGLDLFNTGEGYILVAHDKKTLEDNLDWCRDYLRNSDCKLGYFTTPTGYTVEYYE